MTSSAPWAKKTVYCLVGVVLPLLFKPPGWLGRFFIPRGAR